MVRLDPKQNVAEGDTEFHKLKALLAAAEAHKKEMASELEELRDQVKREAESKTEAETAAEIKDLQSKFVNTNSMKDMETQVRGHCTGSGERAFSSSQSSAPTLFGNAPASCESDTL